MLKIIDEKQLTKSELNQFMSTLRGGRQSIYADVLNKLNENPVGYSVTFQMPANFKFHAPYTLAESLGFKISFKTIKSNTIKIVKKALTEEKYSPEMMGLFNEIFGDNKEYDTTTHRGLLKEIIDDKLNESNSQITILANSSNSIQKAAKSVGKNVSVKNLSKNKAKAPFKFLVTAKRKSA